MKLKALSLIIFCGIYTAKAQHHIKEIAPIIAEGLLMYRSEVASWHGTDLLRAKFPNKTAEVAGYFSYSEGEQTKCVFFDKKQNPTPIITFTFNLDLDINSVGIDTSVRNFTNSELAVFAIRQNALKVIKTDTLFKMYNNTRLNIIPLITKERKKVFVLTGPQILGVVVFGNDYLLTFDKSNQLVSAKQLHKNIIPLKYTGESVETMHSHLPETGDLITSTDICTLMLYGKTANWKSHTVISEKYNSIWDCNKQTLQILTKESL